MEKIISYLGFARKSNNIIIGQSTLKTTTKTVYLIMVCSSATDNLKNLAHNLAKKHDCPIVIINGMLSELTHLDNVKIIGLTDYNLSKAIIDTMK